MKHTPAPWERKWSGHFYNGSSTIITHNDITICQMAQDEEMAETEHDANAALIAAAPELADALLRVLYTVLCRFDGSRVPKQVREDRIAEVKEALRKAGRRI